MAPPHSATDDPAQELTGLVGRVIDSELVEGLSYRLESVLGRGTMGVAFFAQRRAEDGTTPVVLKITRPSFLTRFGDAAPMMILKEAVALGRLNEQVPPTPFVVRLLDSGSLEVSCEHGPVQVPWNAVEYVHGGAEGSTLYDRLERCIRLTGYAFDLERAGHAVRCVAEGLDRIHGVDVIHRDISPGNVLCCGSGPTEVFKIADFGIARPLGLGQTFGEVTLGTPGFAAPEQLFPASVTRIGPWTDVFSLASVVFFLLTGEDYFDAATPIEAIIQARDTHRRRLADARKLCPELAQNPEACAAIDRALARATTVEAEERPKSAGELARLVLPWLTDQPLSRAGSRRQQSLRQLVSQVSVPEFVFTERQRSVRGFVARDVAWDSDGTCLALTTHGLWFWTGAEWRPAPTHGLHVEDLRFVERQSAGRWLLGGEDGLLTAYGADGLASLTRSSRSTTFDRASGDPADLGVLVGTREGDSPRLYAVCAGRWLKPASLPRAANVAALARVEDELWLVVGRTLKGSGFVATYHPLMWESKRLETPDVRAFVACAGNPVLGIGVAVGAEGVSVLVRGDEVEAERLEPHADLSVVALDELGGAWAGARGKLWYRPHTPGAEWFLAWEDPTLEAPFVSLLAQEGRVVALSVDGAIVEGRREPRR